MADKNQLKIADPVDLADDDPFAELTRIMGFDPRQPARKAEPAPAPQPVQAEEVVSEDDFSLDLEKELLGGFDLEDQEQAVEPTFAAEPVAEEPAATAPEVDFDFGGEFDAAMAAPDAFEVPEPVAENEPAFDGDLDAAFAATARQDEPVGSHDDMDFDLGLTDDDVSALDEAAPAPAPLPVMPEAVAQPSEIDADFDAAMAEIDMDFSSDVPATEPVAPTVEAPVEFQAAEAVEFEAADLDPHLFDENDFRFDDELAPAAEAEPEVFAEPEIQAEPEMRPAQELPADSEAQPEIDENVFQFEEDAFHLEDVHPVEELPAVQEQAAAPEPVDEFSFDDVDFGAHDLASQDVAAEAEGPVEAPPVVAESDLTSESAPAAPHSFEFAVPPYVPRKLPTSPMDVAAEEFRQREAASAPEPQFNLEDELNALLGNIKPSYADAVEPAPPAVAESASAEETPAHQPVPSYEQPSWQQAPHHSVFGTSGVPAYGEQPAPHTPQPVGFDAPEHPADIDDNLNWELDDAFAADAAPEQIEEEPLEAYAEDEQSNVLYSEEELSDARYVEDEQPAYADSYAPNEEAPIDLDEVFDELAEEPLAPEPAQSYRDALGAAAIGAAASRFDSGFASRPFEMPSRQQAAEMPRASADAFSPHRDPVVRGNPMKEDPLDIITQLAEKYSRKEPVTPYGRAMSVASGAAPAAFHPEDEVDGDIDISDAFDAQPDVETVEVSDRAVALADDLDIPELPEEELPPVSAYDDLDAEFSSLLSDMNAEPRSAQHPAQSYGDPLAGGFSARPYDNTAAAQTSARSVPAKAYDDDPEPDSFALNEDDLPGSRAPAAGYVDDYEYDPDVDQEIAPAHLAEESRREPKSRGLLLAGLVGGVALIGAVGAFALSFGGGGDDTPAIVRADEGPVKVKPENPGGTTVPNQDNKVYETVAGKEPGEPQQEKLVTTAEEPMDVTPPPPALEEENPVTASGKNEDRIEQILQEAEGQTDAEIVAVAPRKVRTMVVKPDGTLVEREGEPAAAPSGEQTDTIAAATPEAAPAPAIPEATGALPEPALPQPSETASAPTAAPAEEMQAAPQPEAEEQVAAVEPASEDRGAMPDTVPIAPMRPADQPIDVVGEVKPDQVAAATTTAATGGNWAMQIASQPSEAAAQSSYQDLARRYGSVLQGKEVNIVKAEISGKGTFWRVRVPANSRNEAISLCENYKAAGGNCFVSR